MKVIFNTLAYNYVGFAPITATGKQRDGTYVCKEVFAQRMASEKEAENGKIYFIRKDSQPKTPEQARRQQQILRVFEKAMGFRPYAHCKVVERKAGTATEKRWVYTWGRSEYKDVMRKIKAEKFFLYAVSRDWKKNIPLLHILALLTRHYTPENVPLTVKDILDYWDGKKDFRAMPAIREIVANKGEIDPTIPSEYTNGGISMYQAGLISKQAAAKRLGREPVWSRTLWTWA